MLQPQVLFSGARVCFFLIGNLRSSLSFCSALLFRAIGKLRQMTFDKTAHLFGNLFIRDVDFTTTRFERDPAFFPDAYPVFDRLPHSTINRFVRLTETDDFSGRQPPFAHMVFEDLLKNRLRYDAVVHESLKCFWVNRSKLRRRNLNAVIVNGHSCDAVQQRVLKRLRDIPGFSVDQSGNTRCVFTECFHHLGIVHHPGHSGVLFRRAACRRAAAQTSG